VSNLGVNQGGTMFSPTSTNAQRFGVGLNLAVGTASVLSSGDRSLQQSLRALNIASGVWNTGGSLITAKQSFSAAMRSVNAPKQLGTSAIRSLKPTPTERPTRRGQVRTVSYSSDNPLFNEDDAGWRPLKTQRPYDPQVEAIFDGEPSEFTSNLMQFEPDAYQELSFLGDYNDHSAGYASTSDFAIQRMFQTSPDLFTQLEVNQAASNAALQFWGQLKTKDQSGTSSPALNASVEGMSIKDLAERVGIERNCLVCHNPEVLYGGAEGLRNLPLSTQLGIAEALGQTQYNASRISDGLSPLRQAATFARRVPLIAGSIATGPLGTAIISSGFSAIEYEITQDAGQSLDLLPFVGLRHTPDHFRTVLNADIGYAERAMAGLNLATSAVEAYFGAKGAKQLLNRSGYDFYRIPYSEGTLNSSWNFTGFSIRQIEHPTVGLGKGWALHELGNVSIARGRGWTKQGLTNFDSDDIYEFHSAFIEATNNARTIMFNLKGVNVGKAWLEAAEMTPLVAKGHSLVTEWELRQVISNRSLLDKTEFIFNGVSTPGKDYDAVYELLMDLNR
jgi:hypothetical protein